MPPGKKKHPRLQIRKKCDIVRVENVGIRLKEATDEKDPFSFVPSPNSTQIKKSKRKHKKMSRKSAKKTLRDRTSSNVETRSKVGTSIVEKTRGKDKDRQTVRRRKESGRKVGRTSGKAKRKDQLAAIRHLQKQLCQRIEEKIKYEEENQESHN